MDETEDYTFLGYDIPARGEKDFEPDGTDRQQLALQTSRQAMYNALSVERQITVKQYIRADIVNNVGLVRNMKGHMTMGTTRGGICELLPEELLYLVERGNVEAYYNDLPLSLQQVYAVLDLNLDHFQVYSYLRRVGYAVRRSKSVSTSSVVNTMWHGTVHRRSVFFSYDALYCHLQFVPYTSRSYLPITYDVYKPGHYKKTAKPDFQVAVTNTKDGVILSNVITAVVDGVISFLSTSDTTL